MPQDPTAIVILAIALALAAFVLFLIRAESAQLDQAHRRRRGR